MKLSEFTTLTFDCYGTLVDWETGIIRALERITDRVRPALSRDAILEAHARQESLQQMQTPGKSYCDVLAIVCRRLSEAWGVPAKWEDCVAYGNSIGEWPPFADSASSLAYLKQHFRLVILSNVDNQSFSRTNEKLGVKFDAVFTAEDIGSYKPDQRNFQYMLRHLAGMGIEKAEILHVAESLFHDHQPANEAGLASCWIHRRYADQGFGATAAPASAPRFDFRFTSLAELVKAHRLELAV